MGEGWESMTRRVAAMCVGSILLFGVGGCVGNRLMVNETTTNSEMSDLVRAGRIDEAVARVQNMTDFPTLVRVRTAREFEVLWTDPRTQPVLDHETLATRMLALARTELAEKPGNAQAIYVAAFWLRSEGRIDEAIETARRLPRRYLEVPENREHAFVAEMFASSLIARGDVQEGVAILKALTKIPAREKPFLVNQFLNSGAIMMDLGRNEEAIQFANLADTGTSEYGRAVLRRIRTCALHRMGQDEAAQTSLAGFVDTEHQRLQHLHALICLKDFDAAAIVMKRALEGGAPQRMLTVSLQDCAEGPELSPLDREYRADLRRVRDRPDVRPKVDEVMIVLKYPARCL